MAIALGVAAVLGLAPAVPTAGAVTYAPPDTPGPALSPPQADLAAALQCTAGVAGAARDPVLLVPGTTVSPQEFTWNWEPALTAIGRPYCTINLPGNSMGDIQVAGEYVVYAVRAMHAMSGRRVVILGHSQGGMVGRWALRFWPDTRALVSQVIGMSPSNHGTIDADAICATGCAPSIWQQRDTSAFVPALNSYQETFPGIAYTNIYSHTDEVVVPNTSDSGSSALHGGGGAITNVAIQQICPLDVSEHLAVGTYDNVTYQLALDALTHGGPADPSRIDSSVCTQLLMPGVNPLTFAVDYGSTLAQVATTLATYPHVSAEPALACYVTASCTPPSAARSGAPSVSRRAAVRHRSRRRHHRAHHARSRGARRR